MHNPDPKTWRWAPCDDHISSKEKNLPCLEVRDPTGERVPPQAVFEALQASLKAAAPSWPPSWLPLRATSVSADEDDYRTWTFIQGGWPQKQGGGPVSPAGVLKGFHDVSDRLRKVRNDVRPLYGAVGLGASNVDEEVVVREVLELLERYHDLAKGVKNDDAVAAGIAEQVVQVVRKDVEAMTEQLSAAFNKKRSVIEDENRRLRKEVAARDDLIECLTRSRQLDMVSIREFLKLNDPEPEPPPEEPDHAQLDEQDKLTPQCEGCDDCAPKHEGCRAGGVPAPCRFRWVEKTATASAHWRADCGFTRSVEAMKAMWDSQMLARARAEQLASLVGMWVIEGEIPDNVTAQTVENAWGGGPLTDCKLDLWGHTFTVKKTGDIGMNSGRPRYRVVCETCNELLHENTTGPSQHLAWHLREARRKTQRGL